MLRVNGAESETDPLPNSFLYGVLLVLRDYSGTILNVDLPRSDLAADTLSHTPRLLTARYETNRDFFQLSVAFICFERFLCRAFSRGAEVF